MQRSRRLWLGSVAVVAIALGALWSARRPIAEDAIRRSLAASGVDARYVVREIGFRTQRLENISVGDPARPDLTAEWAEVELVPAWGGVRVSAVRAHGVRLRGRLVDGRVSWGAVDRLLPKSNGSPFSLPDIDAALTDTAISLATDMGAVGVALTGRGNLRDGFRGRMVAVSPALQRGDCAGQQVRADVTLAISGSRPSISGPLTVASAGCGGAQLAALRADIRARVPESLDSWTGDARLSANGVSARGAVFATPVARLTFDGNARDTRGAVELQAAAARYADVRLSGLSFRGRYTGLGLSGKAAVARAMFPVPAAPGGLAATPFGPVAERLFAGLRRAGSGTAVAADLSAGAKGVRVTQAVARLPGGGTLNLSDGTGVGIADGKPFADARLTLVDPGLPAVSWRIASMPGGGFGGTLNVAPYTAGSSRVALAPVAVAIGADGHLSIDTRATIDGPLGNGRVDGMTMPVAFRRSADGAMALGQGCIPVSFDRMRIGGTVLGRNTVRACPRTGNAFARIGRGGIAGGVRSDGLRLTGQLDGQPMALTARTFAAGLDGTLAAQALSFRTGRGDATTRLDVARLDGNANGGGRFAGLAGQIGRVPLIVGDGHGAWRYAAGALSLQGTAGVRDAAETPRFLPMRAEEVKLRLAANRIDASATIREPVTRKAVTSVVLKHDLNTAVGDAALTVDALTFGKRLQPEMLTESTKGIVQLVEGQIDGKGLIRWDRKGVTSVGRFTTEGLDLAAAFGTATGVGGTIEFDDLLALSTPTGQRVTIKSINPGVQVDDGTIAFRLRPNQVVEIEGGHWPFAGGDLSLEPATLDFGETAPRRLVLRLTGLDAGKFIERLQLENIAATGTFDGTMPIVFDATGGQVVGGRLIARGAGTLAYVGDVSNSQTNSMTRLAFDALKSLSYRNLAIELDGALDGEIVSRVLFAGTNKAPVAPTGLARSFTGLPFRFNVVVRAPFRGLVNSARSFQDPFVAIQQSASGAKP